MAQRKNRKSERGMALVLALIMLIVVLGAVILVSRQAISAKTQTDMASSQFQLEEACKAGIDHAIQRVWNQYVAGNSDVAGNYASYRTFINGIVPKNSSTTLVTASNPIVLDADRDIRVTALSVSRVDNINGFVLTINATGQVGNQTRRARQTITIGGTPFVGFSYAVLANNINCILCHAEFTNVDLFNNTSQANYGTYDRVRVASLQNLMYRSHTYNGASDLADSRIAGTVYTRGNVINSYSGAVLTDALIKTGSLTAYQFDINGNIIQNPSTGALTASSLSVVTGKDSDGAPLTGGNMYKNYPTDPKLMKDSLLPESFPAPYPDEDGDKVVVQSEYDAISELLNGSVTGGIAFGVPAGSTYAGTSFPTASNGAAASLAANGTYTGNLILTGTAANPIRLDGQIAVDGDLLIRGVVKGTGQIFVKGNTYIAGDVTYADGAKYGVASDGTKNALGIVSGGSILMGDYLTIRGVNPSNDTAATPTSSYSIQTRLANKSANVTVNKKTETMKYGYFDTITVNNITQTHVIDANGIDPARGASQQASFTQSELMIFNNLEMQKAVADPNYKPRFYGLDDSSPTNKAKVYFYDNPSSEHAIRYDEGGVNATTGGSSNLVLTLDAYLAKKGYSSSIKSRATILYLRPKDGWLSNTQLRQMWWDDEQSRTARNSTYKFDGLLYSNNSIFTIVRSYVRHGSFTEGKLRVRGAIICPDIGVLAAGNAGTIASGNTSFHMQYDQRVNDFWAPQDRTQVTFARNVYTLLPQNS